MMEFETAIGRALSAAERFLRNERGAISIDWVGLTAGILLLGMAVVYALFNNGVANTAQNINSEMNDAGRVINLQPRPDPSTFE